MCNYELIVRRDNGDEITEPIDCATILTQPSKVMLLVTEMLHHAMHRDECDQRQDQLAPP